MKKYDTILKNKPIQFSARLMFGGIFIYASLDKIVYPTAFFEIVKSYDLLPVFLAKFVAISLPWAELLFGLFLITGIFMRESTFILTSMMIIFIATTFYKALTGTIGNCGCFSVTSNKTQSIMIILGRDFLLLFLGILILISTRIKYIKNLNLT